MKTCAFFVIVFFFSLAQADAVSVARGGSEAGMSLAQKFLFCSGTFVTFLGIFTLFDWDAMVKYTTPSLKKVIHTKALQYLIASCLCGWGLGKFMAVQAGPKATKTYCQLNLIPFTMLVVSCKAGGEWDLYVYIVFYLAYVYFGFFAK